MERGKKRVEWRKKPFKEKTKIYEENDTFWKLWRYIEIKENDTVGKTKFLYKKINKERLLQDLNVEMRGK